MSDRKSSSRASFKVESSVRESLKSSRNRKNDGRSSKSKSKSPSHKSPSQKSQSPTKTRASSKVDNKSNKGGKSVGALSMRKSAAKSAKTAKSWNTDISVSSTAEFDDFSGQGLTNLSLKIFQSEFYSTILIFVKPNIDNVPNINSCENIIHEY